MQACIGTLKETEVGTARHAAEITSEWSGADIGKE